MNVCVLTLSADSGLGWDCGSAGWKTEKTVPHTTPTKKRNTKTVTHCIIIIIAISHGHGRFNELSTLASSSCEAMKLSWLTFTRSEAVTTVTMRFSSLPTRFPTSSSSRSLASYWMTQSESCQWNQSHEGGMHCREETDESEGTWRDAGTAEIIWGSLFASIFTQCDMLFATYSVLYV